ncbi:MAG: phosphatase PAP2 family protein [Polyangiaceae bacterium]
MLRNLDLSVLYALYGGDHPGALRYLMIALTLLGSGWTLLVLVPFLVARSTRRPCTEMLAAVLGASLIAFALKLAVHRLRPSAALGLRPLWGNPGGFSFPSGHATGSFAVAAFIATIVVLRYLDRPPAVAFSALVALLAIGVGISRVYLGAHYPSDVLAAAVIGASVGTFVGVLEKKRFLGAS